MLSKTRTHFKSVVILLACVFFFSVSLKLSLIKSLTKLLCNNYLFY